MPPMAVGTHMPRCTLKVVLLLSHDHFVTTQAIASQHQPAAKVGAGGRDHKAFADMRASGVELRRPRRGALPPVHVARDAHCTHTNVLASLARRTNASSVLCIQGSALAGGIPHTA